MTLYELTKKYGEGKGEDMMWKAVRVISDAVESEMPERTKNAMIRKIYGAMSGMHYNEELAREDVSKMFYVDAKGVKYPAPYWPEEAVQSIYEDIRTEIPNYVFWDFCVTMNMIAADNLCLLKRWYPNADSSALNEKITEMAINWLNDEDWPTKTKIWDYLSAR